MAGPSICRHQPPTHDGNGEKKTTPGCPAPFFHSRPSIGRCPCGDQQMTSQWPKRGQQLATVPRKMHYSALRFLHYIALRIPAKMHYNSIRFLRYKNAPAPCSAQPIPAHQTDLHLIPHPLASNHRPMQVKRYEPLCGSCTPKGCYLLTCRGHPLHSSAFPLDPFPASRLHGRDAAQNGLRSDASEGRFDPDFSPPSEATNFPV